MRVATTGGRRGLPRLSVPALSLGAFAALTVASWAYLAAAGQGAGVSVRWSEALAFVGSLVGAGAPWPPALLDPGSWWEALGLSLETLYMSVVAIVLAALTALPTFLLGARNVAFGELSTLPPAMGRLVYVLARGGFLLARAVPELVWAMLVVFVLSPGLLAGALALAIHNYGILAKLTAEVVEDMDPRPVRALRSAGAGNFQVLAYAVLPQALPRFLTYLLYRWEVVIRTTVVVGLVTAGGLGHQLRLSMSYFHYDRVGLLLACYLAVVLMVDATAAYLRRLAR